jgi:hypothetical protein
MDQLPQELKTLLGIKPAIPLPALSEEDALEFLQERMEKFRPIDFAGGALEPFGEEGARIIVRRVHDINAGQIGPRQILQAAGWALNQLGVFDVRDHVQLNEVLEELTAER